MKQLTDFFFDGNLFWKIIIFLWSLLTSLFTQAQVNEIEPYKPKDLKLHEEIIKMDQLFFDAYNNCDMKTQEELLSEDIEFYHDNGGVSTSKKEILASLKKNICNKVTRTLIKGSTEVHSIPGYGVVQMGYHKFFNKLEPNQKSIPSRFITLWKKEKNKWVITRVISLH
ncbi:nuclear transport factor 2 family protein [Tenacibaculum sp. MEBiC06402]|uniref:nuclear transport factor 2 family protein n=1 Tax=unclassified Tenacibaculum TaxID=2635139 RepID=UPI003B9BEA5D